MVKLTKIYTRTGDAGETGLVDGSRVAKSCVRIAAFGAVDELNSAIGLAVLRVVDRQLREQLTRIQSELFDLGADLANPVLQSDQPVLRMESAQVQALEAGIDAMNAKLDPLKSFILPGGCESAAHLHMARAICRRAERDSFSLAEAFEVNPHALEYLNRLSDFLFVAARFENRHGAEVLWVPGTGRKK